MTQLKKIYATLSILHLYFLCKIEKNDSVTTIWCRQILAKNQLVLLISIHVPYGVLSSKKIQIDLWLFYVHSYASDKIFGEP